MYETTISGRTSVFHAPVHQVTMGDLTHDAAYLARLGMPGPLSAMASAPVLRCLECGEPASATDLYLESAVPGECADCAADALTPAGHRLSA